MPIPLLKTCPEGVRKRAKPGPQATLLIFTERGCVGSIIVGKFLREYTERNRSTIKKLVKSGLNYRRHSRVHHRLQRMREYSQFQLNRQFYQAYKTH